MELTIPVKVNAPDGATHYHGDILDMPTFYKMKMVGAAGEHWFYWSRKRKEWMLAGHHQPHWTEPLKKEWMK